MARLPERALIGAARGSGWWQRSGHKVTIDVLGDTRALAKGDVSPSVEGQEPAGGKLPGDGQCILVRRGGIEPGADDEDRRRGVASERPAVAVLVSRRPGGTGLGEVGPE